MTDFERARAEADAYYITCDVWIAHYINALVVKRGFYTGLVWC